MGFAAQLKEVSTEQQRLLSELMDCQYRLHKNHCGDVAGDKAIGELENRISELERENCDHIDQLQKVTIERENSMTEIRAELEETRAKNQKKYVALRDENLVCPLVV